MKRLFCLLLILAFTLTAAVICTAETVSSETYDKDSTILGADNVVAASGDASSEAAAAAESPAEALPQTGGIPVEIFYLAGAAFIAAAVFVARKKASSGQNR